MPLCLKMFQAVLRSPDSYYLVMNHCMLRVQQIPSKILNQPVETFYKIALVGFRGGLYELFRHKF
jgi:hypothetical protein